MPRRASRRPAHGRRAHPAAAVLLVLSLWLGGCAQPWASAHPTPAATLVSPLTHRTAYWSQNAYLWALRASDGQVAWKVGGWTGPLPNCGAGCTATYTSGPGAPTLVDGILYDTAIDAQHATPELYAIDAGDGTIRWHTPLPGCLQDAAPFVRDGVIYLTTSGHAGGNFPCEPTGLVLAVRASDGVLLWRATVEPLVSDNPVLIGGLIALASSNSYPADDLTTYLTVLRVSDGARVWRRATMSALSLAAGDGALVATSIVTLPPTAGSVQQRKLDVEAFRAADGQRLWTVEVGAYNGGSVPFVGGGLIYVHADDGYLYALRASDGSVAWRFATGVGFVGTPTFSGGRLYIGAGPALVVLDATSGALLRSYPLLAQPETTLGATPNAAAQPLYRWSRPYVADGAIYVSASACAAEFCRQWEPGGMLFALDARTGTILWQHGERFGLTESAPVVGP